jgi:hypothetical protein
MTAPSDRAVTHPTRLVLLWTLIAILLPTIYFKNSHLNVLYRGGLSGVLKNASDNPTFVHYVVFLFAFSAREVLEVAAVVGVFYVLGSLVLRIKPVYTMAACVFASLVLIGANWLSFRELHTFVSLETATLSLQWIRDDPELLKTYLGVRAIGFFALVLVWCIAPYLLIRRFESWRPLRTARRFATPLALLGLCLASLALSASVHLIPARGDLPSWGYWSSTLRSLTGYEGKRTEPVPLLSLPEIRRQYIDLAYPDGRPADAERLVELEPATLGPRHIVIISLETAPRRYYPILDNPDMPTFNRMCKQAAVTEKHYTSRPNTTGSIHSILSGNYAGRSKDIGMSRWADSDGLAKILSARGYETHYIDSYRIDWHGGGKHRKMLQALGFDTLFETPFDPAVTPRNYENYLDIEKRSLRQALDLILEADARGHKAMVAVITLFGHFDWKSPPGQVGLSARERIYENCKVLDGIIGDFLESLESHGLGEDLLLVVTGDHGLRNEAEFASLGEPMMTSDPAFNVPFILYAPGLLKHETRIPWSTSHIDIVPTLLELVGIPKDPWLHHGESLFDSRLRDRVIFMMNHGLTPVDGYLWRDYFMTYNKLTGISEVGRNVERLQYLPASRIASEFPDIPARLRDPEQVLDRARMSFNCAALYFAMRGASPRTPHS